METRSDGAAVAAAAVEPLHTVITRCYIRGGFAAGWVVLLERTDRAILGADAAHCEYPNGVHEIYRLSISYMLSDGDGDWWYCRPGLLTEDAIGIARCVDL